MGSLALSLYTTCFLPPSFLSCLLFSFCTIFTFHFHFLYSNGFFPINILQKTHQNHHTPMAALNLLCLLILLLLSSQSISISGTWGKQEFEHMPEQERKRKGQNFTDSSSHGRKGMNLGMKLDDSVTNPANFPPFTPTPTIITVPASNPTSVTPQNPPITTVPSPPVTNPVNTYPTPVAAGDIPVAGGDIPIMSWCIARAGTPENSLQAGLDYACGIGGADCTMIQEGGSCYNPNSIENHASYAFNSYFQKNPVPSSCDFGGVALLVNTNPSTGSCILPSSATPVAMPSSTFSPATTSSTSGATGTSSGVSGSGGYVSPPSVLNTSNPTSGSPAIYGQYSPPTGTSVPAGSSALQPVIGFVVLVASFSTGKLLLST